ncbi:hypothetical protein NPS01_22460 [Nocardioides psychrotolerans]|uniref:SEC-C motif-containing protein n=1 Tax=Nocardioides psychrotolerans TaxID=1005945 RepID=A0A1I3I6K1_9ACTN|nr:SEC-C domain-containing protein [Nocardioides psychrotolerans]GEP38583.1 hypothetical protein NPS01_22460 [Nocardioides psychrotolerans]SFI43542.1 SEC-C motif-containing protein [Nocardioides psychrotolerans]
MTLIGFATYGDRAELITDTLSYASNLSSLGYCTKHHTIPHLDAVVMTRGDSAFSTYATTGTLTVSQDVDDFDQLVEQAPALLRALWGHHTDDEHLRMASSTLYLMGYSPEQKKFTAHMFFSDQDFKHVRVHGSLVMPSPWDFAPSGYEMRLLKDSTRPHRQSLESRLVLAERWRVKPVLPRPSSVDEWRALAISVREQRTLNPFFTILVGGQVMHCLVERGRSVTTSIHTFDDTGDELGKMVNGTCHPASQKAPCWCGSGLSFRDCHLAAYFAEGHTCDCQSGRSFEDCCRVPDSEMPNANA